MTESEPQEGQLNVEITTWHRMACDAIELEKRVAAVAWYSAFFNAW